MSSESDYPLRVNYESIMLAKIFPHPLSRIRRFVLILILVIIIGSLLNWQRTQLAKPRLTVDINGHIQEFSTDAQTVEEALQMQGILVEPVDIVSPALDTPINADMTITIQKANQLVLDLDGNIQRIYTHQTNPFLILQENAIVLQPFDRLYINYILYEPNTPIVTWSTPIKHLRVIHTKNYTIYDGDKTYSGITAATYIGDVLHEEGVSLYLADQVFPPLDAPLSPHNEIQIMRSSPVYIHIDGRDFKTRAVGPTVSDVLNMLGLPLTGQDYTIPDENTSFTADMNIEVVRVIEKIEVYEEKIPFQTLTLLDPDLQIDEERIVQFGIPGVRASRIRIRTENGLEVSRIIQETWTVTEPIPQIVAYGGSTETPTPE